MITKKNIINTMLWFVTGLLLLFWISGIGLWVLTIFRLVTGQWLLALGSLLGAAACELLASVQKRTIGALHKIEKKKC